MSALRLLSRWKVRSTLSAPSSLRMEIRPPSLCHKPDSSWQRVMFWLLAATPRQAAPPLNRLPAVRTDFMACLADVSSAESRQLVDRIDRARSLRELWHLRAEVYRLVAVRHNQALAEERLTRLNRHFPNRAPRPAFAPL